MKNKLGSKYLQLGVIGLALTFGGTAWASSPREDLVHAARLIQTANQNYDGHRMRALNEVVTAGKELGVDLTGEVNSRERQWKSDEQLREARRLLQESRNKLERVDRDRVAGHVDAAINELDAALRVK